MITYELNKEDIFLVRITGDIVQDDIKNYLYEFKNIDNLPKNLLTFYDLQNANINLSFTEIVSMARLAKKVTLPYDTVRTAFLVNKPNITAYALLFIQAFTDNKNVRKVFTKSAEATGWLKSSI